MTKAMIQRGLLIGQLQTVKEEKKLKCDKHPILVSRKGSILRKFLTTKRKDK